MGSTDRDSAVRDLLEVLPLYRQMGFFADRAHLDDPALAVHLFERYCQRTHGHELRTGYPRWDLSLLWLDEERTWSYDTECVFRDDRVYAELIERLARISRGLFRPTDVAEEWDGPFGPIHLRFRWQGRTHEIHLGEMETDFMDPQVLEYLEPLISTTTPYGVVHLCTGDQTDTIVLLTDAERERLERERPDLFDFENAYG